MNEKMQVPNLPHIMAIGDLIEGVRLLWHLQFPFAIRMEGECDATREA